MSDGYDRGPVLGKHWTELDAARQDIKRLRAELEDANQREARLLERLESIRVYGSDTLSGRVDGTMDREWLREGIREMVRRATPSITETDDG